MRGALLAGFLLLATPSWAQVLPPGTVTRTGDVEEIVVEVNGVKAGLRTNLKTGEKWELKYERNPLTLGLTKRLHAHKVEPLPTEKVPLSGPGLSVPLPLPTTLGLDTAMDATPVVVDVNILYTAAAAAARGGVGNMPAFAALACATATQTASNSGSSNITYTCLGPFQVAYSESSGVNPLIWMGSTGFTPVNTLRAQTGADLSHLITTNNACGQGVLCSSSSTSSSISQSSQECTVSGLTFVHETGHNLCMNHDPANAGCSGGTGPGTSCPNSNYGHGWGPARDVMSYPSAGGTRVTQFSNPDVLHSGLPTGIASKRDNALALRTKAPIVAAFRTRVGSSTAPAITSVVLTQPSAPVITGVVLQ